MIRHTMFRVLAGGLVTAMAAGAIAQEAAPSPAKPLCEIEVGRQGEPLVVPVQLQGRTCHFLLDTGASHTTFHEPLESLLGKPKESIPVEMRSGETHTLNIYYAPEATVGMLDLQRGGSVYCVDLTDLREVTGLDIQGVLGMGLMRRYVMQIDFDAGKLRFYDSDDGKHPDWGTAIAIDLLPNGVPFTIGRLFGSYKAVFLLDTGYGDTGLLDARLFGALKEQKGFQTAAIKFASGGAEARESLVARVEDFRLGPHAYTGLVFDKGAAASMLGLEFLSRHLVTFDFPNLKLYLKPGLQFNKVDQNDMSGLHLLKKPGGVTVHSVDAGSPAAQAGIQAGDILKTLDQQPVESLSLWQIRRLLRRGEGLVVEVVFRRGQQDYQAKLILKKQI